MSDLPSRRPPADETDMIEYVVWHGSPPLSNAHAASEYKRQRTLAERGPAEPDDAIRDLVDRLSEVDTQQVATGRSMAVVKVDHTGDSKMRSFLAEACSGHGLVAYDPQARTMVPSAVDVKRTVRFQLPQSEQLNVHLRALLGEQAAAPWPVVGVIDHLETGYYLQWLACGDSITVEAQGDEVLDPYMHLSEAGQARMRTLGFAAGSPNWLRHCGSDKAGLADAAGSICAVLFDMRAVLVGDGVSIQTFPAGR